MDDSADWESWTFGRWGKSLYPTKIKNRFEPPRNQEIGTIGRFGRLGDPGHTRDSGDLGDLGDSGNSGDGEIVTLAEVGNAAGPKKWRADELGN